MTLFGLILYNMDDVSRTFTSGLRINVTVVNFALQIDNCGKSVEKNQKPTNWKGHQKAVKNEEKLK